MDSAQLGSQERGLEQSLGGSESLVANGQDSTIGHFVGLLQTGAGSSSGHFLVVVQGNVAHLFLDISHDFPLSSRVERVASLGQDPHEVVCDVSAGDVHSGNSVGQGVAFVDGHDVRHTISGVKHDTSGSSRGVQRQHSLDLHVHGGTVEGLEHDLGHLFPADNKRQFVDFLMKTMNCLYENSVDLIEKFNSSTLLRVRLIRKCYLTCWLWGSEGPRSAKRGAPQGPLGARCRKCGARSSPCRPSWLQFRARWGTSG